MFLHARKLIPYILKLWIARFQQAVLPPAFRSQIKALIRRKPTTVFTEELVVNNEAVIDRHLRICRTLKQAIDGAGIPKTGVACEIGNGDCLTSADLVLSEGFKKVYLVEFRFPKVDCHQMRILQVAANASDLANALSILKENGSGDIDSERVIHIPGIMETTCLPEPVDFMFSFDVLEHVGDLDLFFKKCSESLKPGGYMVHKFDLSGHGVLEDPIPPLDFQTYPDWIYDILFPNLGRAARNPFPEFLRMYSKYGFEVISTEAIRSAPLDYVRTTKPRLRSELQGLSDEMLAILDVIVVAVKM